MNPSDYMRFVDKVILANGRKLVGTEHYELLDVEFENARLVGVQNRSNFRRLETNYVWGVAYCVPKFETIGDVSTLPEQSQLIGFFELSGEGGDSKLNSVFGMSLRGEQLRVRLETRDFETISTTYVSRNGGLPGFVNRRGGYIGHRVEEVIPKFVMATEGNVVIDGEVCKQA